MKQKLFVSFYRAFLVRFDDSRSLIALAIKVRIGEKSLQKGSLKKQEEIFVTVY